MGLNRERNDSSKGSLELRLPGLSGCLEVSRGGGCSGL